MQNAAASALGSKIKSRKTLGRKNRATEGVVRRREKGSADNKGGRR